MSEVIKTILTADSSELRAEFGKAASALANYQAAQQAGFSKALAGADLELRALRLEADGFKALANSMREQTALKEQAARLSAAANISEKEALGILQQKLVLQKSIASAAQQEAAQRAAATAETIRQAAAQKQLAAEAAALAQKAQASFRQPFENQSAAILEATAAARRAEAARASAIDNPRATGLPGVGGLAPLTPQSLQAIDRQIFLTRELQRQTLSAGQAGKGSALGLLAFSQAVEDAQYGFRGIINNIPQVILGFGGFSEAASRLAAKVSLLAVAGYAAYKAGYAFAADSSIVDWAETQSKGLDAAKKALESYQDQARKQRERVSLEERINQEKERGNSLIEKQLKLDDDVLQAIEKQRSARERQRAGQNAILAAAASSGEFTQSRVTNAKRNLEDTRTVEDTATAQQRLNDLGEDWQRIWKETANIAGDFGQKSRIASQELEQAIGALGVVKSKQVELESYINGKGLSDSEQKNFAADLENIKKLVDEREKLVAEKTAEFRLNEEQAKSAATQGKASLEQLRKLQEAERERLTQLPEEIKLRKQLRQIEDAKVARAANENRANVAEEAKAALKEWNQFRKTQQNTTADFGTELAALKLELQGRKQLADNLRKEMGMRREAARIAEATGQTEAQALQYLREKARLEDAINQKKNLRQDNLRNPGAVRNDQLGSPSGGGSGGLSTGGLSTGGLISGGQRAAAIGQRALQREAANRAIDPTIKLLENSNTLQDQMLAIWKKITTF